MEVRKGYKKTELGIIPDDWEIKKIGIVGEVKMCRRIFNNETNSVGEIPFYKIGTFGKAADAYISKELYDDYRQKFSFPKKGDILISAAGTIGRTSAYDGEPAYFQDSNIVWIENSGNVISNEYLSYVLQIAKYNTEGGTIKRLYNNILKSTSFICPPPSEQTAIATALSDADALIAGLEKLIAKKRNIKQGAMQELLKPKEGWEVKTVNDLAICLDSFRIPLNDAQRSSMKGDYPYCGANGVLDFINEYLIDDDIILIAEDGGYFDEYLIRPIAYKMTGKCWVNNHAHILKAKENIHQDFIYYSLVHKNILRFLANGTRAKLNKSEMYKIEIDTPKDYSDQVEIATILSDMDSEITALETKLEKYKMIKQGMMQTLLTGKIRLI